MNKLAFMVMALALMMFAVMPAIAGDTSDLNYMNSVRAEYMDKVNSEGQTMIFDDVKLVGKGSPYSFPLTVGTGDYEIWAIGGRGIQNLNVRIYSADGSLLAENSATGNYPALSFSEPVSRSHRVEVRCSEFAPGVTQGYFLVIVIRND